MNLGVVFHLSFISFFFFVRLESHIIPFDFKLHKIMLFVRVCVTKDWTLVFIQCKGITTGAM